MYLLLAKKWLEDNNIKQSRLVIIPGKNEGYRTQGSPHEKSHSQWRLRQLLAPCALAFLPRTSLVICQSREEGIEVWENNSDEKFVSFPESYTPHEPDLEFSIRSFCEAEAVGSKTACFEASPQAIEYIDQWIQAKAGNRKLVAITLRQASYQATRNSDIESWIQFANSLDAEKYLPVFVPDIECALEQSDGLGGVHVFSEACFNIELRFALYSRAWLNMMVNTGPSNLCAQSDDIRYIYFKLVTQGIECADLTYFEKERFLPGRQWPCANDTQKLIWEDDALPALRFAFELMEDRLEGAGIWSENGIVDTIDKCLKSGDLQTAGYRSACFLSFYQESLDAWLLRAEILFYLNRRYEAFLVLLNANERFPEAANVWREREFLLKQTEELRYLQLAFADLVPSGLQWRAQRSFSALEEHYGSNSAKTVRAYIFGAGQGGRLAHSRLPDWINRMGFVDSDPNKRGSKIDGLTVYASDRLKDYDCILIASMAGYQIFEQLCISGVDPKNIYLLESQWIIPDVQLGQPAPRSIVPPF